ncbi:MAG: hypothetical protein GY941_13460 [Planctomycetes bacterium]|nr:hypothetical protein [Planctomycetota bacterium]
MATETMRELAVRSADGAMVNTLTEENSILATMLVEKANNGIQNVTKKMSSVTGAKIVDLDAPIETVSAKGELVTTDVSVLAGKQEIGVDTANLLGGPANYFSEYMPTILEETGNNIEKSFIYNTVKPFGKTHSKGINAGGSNSGAMYSMVCIRWQPMENVALYSEDLEGSGLNFNITPLSNGGVYENANSIPSYGQLMKTNLGFQLVNPRYVSYIANIDLVQTTPGTYDALPSKKQIQQLIRDARATNGNSYIYCHPAVLDALADEYMSEVLRVNVNDDKFNYTFVEWNGIKFVTSWNFLETEATEVFA